MKYLIYAAYGSNLLKGRFIVYIKGGEYQGRKYEGSRDKTEPEDFGWMFAPHRLYFAKKSELWNNKGVAFLSCKKETNPNYYSVVRLWKVSEIQFEDIRKQEGEGWYNETLFLGKREGLEIFTITGSWEKERNKPDEKYLEVIKKGLKETTNWSDEEIENYIKKFI